MQLARSSRTSMKKIAIIRFPKLLSDEDHLLTCTFFTAVWFQDYNDETMIDYQSRCQKYTEIVVVRIVSMIGDRIEFEVVFDHW